MVYSYFVYKMNSMFAEYLNQHAILAVLSNFRRYEINVVRLFMPGRGRIARLPFRLRHPN